MNFLYMEALINTHTNRNGNNSANDSNSMNNASIELTCDLFMNQYMGANYLLSINDTINSKGYGFESYHNHSFAQSQDNMITKNQIKIA